MQSLGNRTEESLRGVSELFAVLANLTQQLFEQDGRLRVTLLSYQPVRVHRALPLHRQIEIHAA